MHLKADQVSDELFVDNPLFDPRDLLQVKYEMLRRVRVDGHAVCPGPQMTTSRPFADG